MLSDYSTNQLINELIRRGAYYEEDCLYNDSVIHPDLGLLYIYDIREDWYVYTSGKMKEPYEDAIYPMRMR